MAKREVKKNYRCEKDFITRSGKSYKYGDTISEYQLNLLNNNDQRYFVDEEDFVDKREPVEIAPAESSVIPTPQEITQYDLQDYTPSDEFKDSIVIDTKVSWTLYHYRGTYWRNDIKYEFEIRSGENETDVIWENTFPFEDEKDVREQIIAEFLKQF
jgi:hypothetical protein